MAKTKKEIVVLAEFDMYDLDGTLTYVVKCLQEYQQLALEQGLTNVRMDTDYEDVAIYEYGGYQGKYEKKWTTKITGEKDA